MEYMAFAVPGSRFKYFLNFLSNCISEYTRIRIENSARESCIWHYERGYDVYTIDFKHIFLIDIFD